jgi:hypothetical protein
MLVVGLSCGAYLCLLEPHGTMLDLLGFLPSVPPRQATVLAACAVLLAAMAAARARPSPPLSWVKPLASRIKHLQPAGEAARTRSTVAKGKCSSSKTTDGAVEISLATSGTRGKGSRAANSSHNTHTIMPRGGGEGACCSTTSCRRGKGGTFAALRRIPADLRGIYIYAKLSERCPPPSS